MHLRGKNRYKQIKEINKLLNKKINGIILKDECTNIIKYMYNENDSQHLLRKLNKLYVYKHLGKLEMK